MASKVKSLLTLDPDTYLELFDLYIDASIGFLRIHAGKNFDQNIMYKGLVYQMCPINFDGAETNSSGALPRPTITISNINGLVTDYIKNKNDLNNCIITRTKVLIRNIDDSNFPKGLNPYYGFQPQWNSSLGYGPEYFKDSYIVNNKKTENKYRVEFELASPLDLENIFLPSRKINDNLCSFVYRGAGCCYGKINNFVQQQRMGSETVQEFKNIGLPVADVYNKAFIGNEQYGISTLRNRGVWSETKTYYAGDFVLVQSIFTYDFSKESVQSSSDDLVGTYYVCVAESGGVSGVDNNPKFDRVNWIRDECSKTVEGCKLRWQQYTARSQDTDRERALPYGGFPGTRPYEYKT